MRQNTLEENGNNLKLTTVYDATDHLVRNMHERNEIGRGFSKDRNCRKIASIPMDDMMALIARKNGDAIAAMGGDDKAMRRLIRAHPEWRCSEGGI